MPRTKFYEKKYENVDEYIAEFPTDIQKILEQIRAVIRKAAPAAGETISYQMPSYKLNGKPLVYFAAFSKHIGFYAIPTGHAAFANELSKYKQGKGSVQFPLDQPMPFELVNKLTEFCVSKNSEKSKNNKSANS